MKNLRTAAIAASIVGLAVPAAALTVQSSNPIAIQQVTSSPEREFAPGVVRITYRNTAGVAAREVTFRINDAAGRSADVEDVGTFAPGVTVSHEFQMLKLGDGAQARVMHVELADDSAWNAPFGSNVRRQAAEAPANPGVEYGL
jgi:hypothetical protein